MGNLVNQLNVVQTVSVLTVFVQGLLSFFSPCVLPLLPLYIGYLSGGAKTVDADGNICYKRGKVMLNTAFFVLGVSFAFFVLGLGFTAAGMFFHDQSRLISIIGGVLVIFFGLFQLGVFGTPGFMAKERRLPFHLDVLAMNPLVALALGFTFSFAWTPCVGPALGSVLTMATSTANAAKGYLLIGVYTLGFILPFLAVGLFTGTLLDLFKKHQKVVRYTVKIGGALLIVLGVMMITGWMNGLSGMLSASAETAAPPAETEQQEDAATDEFPAPDFTLLDQFGNTHTLSEYKGKTVFLNFWATWCPPCRAEMPEIQQLYEAYGLNAEDVIILGIAAPDYYREGNEKGVVDFLAQNNYTYPVVMDPGGVVFDQYYIQAFPTTFMIDANGNIYGYASGQLTYDIMEDIIRQTVESIK